MPKALYICYFGLREPLVQTQVLPYLREIVKDGVEMHLLTFEPENWSSEDAHAEVRSLAGQGITWHRRRYHKWPSVPATLYDILVGTLTVRSLTKRFGFDILHARVHLPALMASIARRLIRQKPKILFDIRGFFPEEYTDAGIWPEDGLLYRTAKRIEKWLFKEADGFVVLTEKARDILFPNSRGTGFDALGRPVGVIPCCVDLKRFDPANSASRAEVREELGLGDRFVAAYVGAFGGWYLTDETADLFGAMRDVRPDAFLLILTQSDPEKILPRLRTHGFADSDLKIMKVASEDIPKYLSAADLAVSFIKPSYSKQASSPTKNAEYLAAGLPIIANSNVGDVDALMVENGVGVLIDSFDQGSYLKAIQTVLEMGDISERCRAVAREQFDLEEVGGARYRRLYQNLLQT
jgi:glycosyltransferase involved in cell wall biosynthesis